MSPQASGIVLSHSVCMAASTTSAQAASELRLAVEGGDIVLPKGSTRKTLTTRFDRAGQTEVGPVGDFGTIEADIEASGQRGS
jgi:hypothetical protein